MPCVCAALLRPLDTHNGSGKVSVGPALTDINGKGTAQKCRITFFYIGRAEQEVEGRSGHKRPQRFTGVERGRSRSLNA